MKRRTFTKLALASAGSLALGAPLRAAAGSITVTDTLGRDVTVPSPARRVLLGFYFEDFWAIGGPDAYDHVVAISRPAWEGWRNSQWKAYTAINPRLEDLVDVGEADSGTFSIESAIAARPDVAILAAWQYSSLGDGVQKLEAAGIPVVVADYNAQTVEKHVISTRMIGQIMGTQDRAEALANTYAAAVADVVARVGASGARPKSYVELGSKGAGEIGNSYGDTMWGRVVETAGGSNIAKSEIAKWGPLNPEYVLAQNPEAVFIAGSYWTSRPNAVLMGFGVDPAQTRARLAPYADRPGWADMAAFQSGTVHALYHGGARTLHDYAYLQYIAKALHPEAFADLDPQQTLRDHYTQWLPIAANGTFMLKL